MLDHSVDQRVYGSSIDDRNSNDSSEENQPLKETLSYPILKEIKTQMLARHFPAQNPGSRLYFDNVSQFFTPSALGIE